MGTTPEGKVKKKLDTMLKSKRDVWYFPPQAGPFGRSGVPDRIACVAGQLIGIEAKADASKKPTAMQQQCMDKIEAAGGKCFLVYDEATIQEVEEYIDAIRMG